MAGAWATSTSQNATSISEVDPTDHLPLSLLRSELIPPAPNRSESAIDWLPDFAVFEISSVASSPVTAVSWSPVTPSSGELAVASDNCICLFSHDSATPNPKGSFCWSQNAVLLQSTKVEAVGWTASGDGLIAGGLEVVLWKRKSKSWEIAWKFKADQPQNMVSASWSIEGPSAAASSSKDLQIEGVNEASKSVLVFYCDGSSGFAKTVLGHPQPVSMLQWRPSAGKQLLRDGKHLRRHILLTCCLDGTIRLWSEIDKYISFTWAMEIGGMVKTTEETNQYFFREEHKNEVGSCEWLIGFGPGKLVTFWAIHCLDDISPMRFPRVTLWKRLELQGLEVEHLNRNGLSTLKQQLLLKKVVIMRNCASGPPTVCSSIHLYPCKYLAWSMLYTQMINDTENAPTSESRTENLLSCSVEGILDIDGHTSRILQVAIHPYVCEVDLVVSLDSNGLLLFWSLSNNSNAILDLPTLIPAWRISGKHVTHGKCSKYSSLNWAPLVLGEDRFLLLGHVGGIDCFAVKNFHGEGDGIECYFICTIPFAGHDPYEDGPTNIYTVPLSLSRNETYMCDGFLLLGIWMKIFRALSWEITMHAYDLTRSCSECNFNDDNIVECNARKFEKTISGTRYCLHVIPSSAQLPEPHLHDQVTSFAVISPGGLTPVQQKLPFHKDSLSCRSPAYVMATGCCDGSIKLWRCSPNEPSISHKSWELVGMFSAHQGPVTAIRLTSCGRKIATTGSDSPSNTVFNLRIWDSIRLPDSGTFMLEDTLSLDEDVVVLNWLALGNGQLLLAVCMRNELRVYAQKRCGGHALLDSKQSPGVQFWFCIGISHTFSAIHDFLWGPRTTDNKHQTDFYKKFNPESLLDSDIDMGKDTFSEIFSDHDVVNHKETLIANSNGGCKYDLLKKINTNNGHLSSAFLVGRGQIKCKSKILLGYWSMLDIVATLARVLPVYHPESLFANIYSGNRKRAYISVKHLVEYLNSSHISEKRGHHPKISDIVPQMPLSDYIEGILSKSSTGNAFQWNENATSMTLSSQFQSGLVPFAYNFEPNASSNAFSSSSTKSGLIDFLEPINKLHELAAITATEKMQILAIVDLLNEVSNPQSASVYENLDEPGRRFWVTLRFQQLLFLQRFGRSASLEDLVVDSGLIAWAFHSDCQETLFGSFLPNEPSWPAMRTLGVGFWFTNATQLRTRAKRQMESWARMHMLKKKDEELEALECLSSSLSILGGMDQENVSDFACSKTSLGILKPSIGGSSPWLLGGVASHLESYAKFDLALQYISKLMREHPSWPRTSFGSVRANTCSEDYENQYDELLENFHHKLHTGLAQFEHKFSLVSSYLINMIFVTLCNNGFWFLGYDMLHGFCHEHSQHENHMDDNAVWYPLFHKPLLKLTEDISSLFSHFLAICSTTWSPSKLCYRENGISHEGRSNSGDTWGFYFQGVKLSLSSLRAAMRIFSGIFKEVMSPKLLTLLDLYEFYANFASAWLQKNSEGLVLMMQPLIVTYTSGHTPYEVDMMALKETLNQVPDTVTDVLIDGLEVDKCAEEKQVGELLNLIPEDERWHIIGAFVWQHMSRFMKHKLNSLAISDDSYLSGFSNDKLSSCAPLSLDVGLGNRSIRENIRSASWILANLLKIALEHISSHHVKQLGLFLQQKIDNGFNPPTLGWLEEYRLSSRTLHQHLGQTKDTNSTNQLSASDILWNMCADPTMISESFAQEKVNWSSFLHFKPCRGWDDLYKDIRRENETDESQNHEGKISNSSSGGEAGSPSRSVLRNGHAFLSSWQKGTSTEKEVIPFQNPKEIYKRNGELLEALCVNSINQRQAALASNRKGIIFFNWEDGIPYKGQSDYIWSGADWPHNGWAGCESTPVPTCVSPGVGLGNQKGAHLGLGGATIGVDTFSRPGRHLTGGGAFGIPGYAGIGASGLGWETQEDFEEFVDLPATVENISTRSFSSHPSRPLFLVGSINTHIYLWEFGKDKATATYGVLPAANVAPPYALASISALQFDRCGHRFVTAALDGTVCTWQLEVGGRSNIRPTESSLCFNNHASDVTYITSSGSVIAAAGCSSNGVNVVIWDTLAPSATSRASIVCHEGGARSIAVFDNDIGSGSVSPLIVTGGKNGDVGLHDFRYIATGRTKRHRHHDSVEISINTSSNADMKKGASKQRDQNHGGMLWYIPKAHLGSITKISTIPNTSLFLTGSKDGDVKLWDAKAAKLVHHWSKLHERHTFLQPSSRGFGGVVRAAVTDIQVVSHGFLSCGGDGSVKLVQLND
ncbi:hypothetical protein GOBAR_DD13933 [Gossypium barbadense]|nr:hypothetical protein GOBAR_DD13933 [Gossypium barbadense]